MDEGSVIVVYHDRLEPAALCDVIPLDQKKDNILADGVRSCEILCEIL